MRVLTGSTPPEDLLEFLILAELDPVGRCLDVPSVH
jgi:hypothetical protein